MKNKYYMVVINLSAGKAKYERRLIPGAVYPFEFNDVTFLSHHSIKDVQQWAIHELKCGLSFGWEMPTRSETIEMGLGIVEMTKDRIQDVIQFHLNDQTKEGVAEYDNN